MNKHLTEGPIGATVVADWIARHQDKNNLGAHAFFIGQVRADQSGDVAVTSIEYSAYEEMVEMVVSSIREEILAKYPAVACLHLLHSTGMVKAGEASLLVMVSGKHRTAVFTALDHCVELIKEKLPVWKKEHFSDGSTRWIEDSH